LPFSIALTVGSDMPLCIATSSCVKPSVLRRARIIRPKSEALEMGTGAENLVESDMWVTPTIVEI
jgi:hypothetical protein